MNVVTALQGWRLLILSASRLSLFGLVRRGLKMDLIEYLTLSQAVAEGRKQSKPLSFFSLRSHNYTTSLIHLIVRLLFYVGF